MAKISDKNIRKLGSWDSKELRKLKIMSNNRIDTLSLNPKKELKEKHLLYNLEISELKKLIEDIKKAERDLANK